MAKSAQLAMHSATLLAEEVRRLRAENARQKKKKQARRSYIAQGGVLTIEQGLQLIEEKERKKQAAGSTTQRLCSICRLPGHNKRNCPGIQESDDASIQDSIHVIY